MTTQIIKSPQGEDMVVLPKSEFDRIVAELEDLRDIRLVQDYRRRAALGEAEYFPAEIVNRILDGEQPVQVLRNYRGLTAEALAAQAGISRAYLTQIEQGRRIGKLATLQALAKALRVDLGILAGPGE